MLAMLATRVGMIGAGRMATALARGFIEAHVVAADKIAASDPVAAAREAFSRDVAGVKVSDDNASVVEAADVLILAVKPQTMDAVLTEIRSAIAPDT